MGQIKRPGVFGDLDAASQAAVEEALRALPARERRIGAPGRAAAEAGLPADRPALVLQLFRRIGTPLITAVSEVQGWLGDGDGDGAGSPDREAEILGELIGRVVAVSQAVADRIGRPEDAGVRLAAAGIVSPLVATLYRLTGRPPGEREAGRILSAVDALSSLSAMPAAAGGPAAAESGGDWLQGAVALTPVVGAVARFSFGHPEHRLIREVVERLHGRARAIGRDLEAEVGPARRRALEQGILEAAAQIYAECHYAEMDRLLEMSPEERTDYARAHGNALPMTHLWRAFDLRMEMLAAVAAWLKPPGGGAAGEEKSAGEKKSAGEGA